MDSSVQYMFKIILIGDSGVGKTSLMTRFTDKCYEPSTFSTIGVDFKIKTIELNGLKIKLHIWDTAGQERFRAVVSGYYRGAHGIFIVFDMLNKDSFVHLTEWMDELERKGAINTAEIMILGNKSEDKSKIAVSNDEIAQFLEKYGISESNYFEVSAKDNIRVEESFEKLAIKLVEKFGVLTAKTNGKSKLIFDSSLKKRNCC